MAEANIKGVGEISCDPIVASEAITLCADLMRVVGVASGRLPAIIMGYSDTTPEANAVAELQAIQGIVDIIASTSSAEMTRLVQTLVETARIRAPSGTMRQLSLDGDFTGNLPALVPVLKFVIEVQFRDFFIASMGNGLRRFMANE